MSGVPSLPEQITVRRWTDPLVERYGFPVNSVYSEAVLLPILGPASVLCLRRLSAWAVANPGGVAVDTRQLARDLGLGIGLGPNAVITRTIRRLCQFDLARWAGGERSVRTSVAPLPERQLRRLSPGIVQLHRAMVDQRSRQARALKKILGADVSIEDSTTTSRRPSKPAAPVDAIPAKATGVGATSAAKKTAAGVRPRRGASPAAGKTPAARKTTKRTAKSGQSV